MGQEHSVRGLSSNPEALLTPPNTHVTASRHSLPALCTPELNLATAAHHLQLLLFPSQSLAEATCTANQGPKQVPVHTGVLNI